jgi:large subunit ribosomal protein L13
MKTYVPRRRDLQHDWWLVNAEGLTLGRLATAVAVRLRGKHKPVFTPFLDTGDHDIVVNAEKIALTGRKWSDKMYRRHSGYPGGLTELTAKEMLTKHPHRLVELAVKGMLPKGPLGRRLVRKLKVYVGPSHPHESQKPQALELPGAASRAH